MATKTSGSGIFDMDRLARVFTWLMGGLMIFVLGMIFMQVINADFLTVTGTSDTAATSTTTTAQ